jgi:peptide/nickel transport system ATP-binding protein
MAPDAFLSVRALAAAVLHDVNLELARGRILGLVGPSGSGKSTLARTIALFDRPGSGEVLLEGRRLSSLGGRERRQARAEIQLIFQEPAASLNPRFTAEEIVTEPLRIQKASRADDRFSSSAARQGRKSAADDGPDARGSDPQDPFFHRITRAVEALRRRAPNNDGLPHGKAEKLMEMVGLPASALGRRPLEFSGGERQRLAIARALALRPKLLILDESLSGLDLSVQAQIANLLLDLRDRHGLTSILISHDLSLAAQIADEIAVMDAGTIVEHAPTAELLGAPRHVRTRELLAAARALAIEGQPA